MNKQQAQEQMAKLQAEMDSLKKIIDAPENTGKRWRAGRNEIVFYTDVDGMVEWFYEVGDTECDTHYSSGNYFQTHEEAAHYKDVLIATQKIKDRIAELNAEQGWIADWRDHCQDKFLVFYNHSTGNISDTSYSSHQFCNKGFYGSEKTIKQVIEELEPELKLYFGVEE